MKWNALSVDVTERKKMKVFGALNVRWSGTIATLAAFGHPHTVKSAIETMDESCVIYARIMAKNGHQRKSMIVVVSVATN